MGSSDHKRYLHVGPGGTKCPCCFPAPGSSERRRHFKRVRQEEKRNTRQHIDRELEEDKKA